MKRRSFLKGAALSILSPFIAPDLRFLNQIKRYTSIDQVEFSGSYSASRQTTIAYWNAIKKMRAFKEAEMREQCN